MSCPCNVCCVRGGHCSKIANRRRTSESVSKGQGVNSIPVVAVDLKEIALVGLVVVVAAVDVVE